MRTLTVTPARGNGNGTHVAPPVNGSRRALDKVAVALGLKWRVAPKTAARWLEWTHHFVADAIGFMREYGLDERRARYLERIERAKEGRFAPPDCDATWQLAQDADTREDAFETAYLRAPTIQNRQRLIEATRNEIRAQSARLDMLVDEQERAQRAAVQDEIRSRV